jgi:two-component system, NarL family, nitrate/nitrite response regulator NarL
VANRDASYWDDRIFAKPARVVLICRVRLYRDAVVARLNRNAGIIVVGVADGNENIQHDLDELMPDIVLLDVGTPGSLTFATQLVRAHPQIRVLGFGIDDVPANIVACATAGLCGYVPSFASIGQLAEAIRRAAVGETVCSSVTAGQIFDYLRSSALAPTLPTIDSVLTRRQQQILHLIDEGLSNKQIARRLSVGTSTVKNHVHNILERLQVGRRSEAAARMNMLQGSGARPQGGLSALTPAYPVGQDRAAV